MQMLYNLDQKARNIVVCNQRGGAWHEIMQVDILVVQKRILSLFLSEFREDHRAF